MQVVSGSKYTDALYGSNSQTQPSHTLQSQTFRHHKQTLPSTPSDIDLEAMFAEATRNVDTLTVFRRFIKLNSRNELDASALFSPECLRAWLASHEIEPLDPEVTFLKDLCSHVRGLRGKEPFTVIEEEAVLQAMREQEAGFQPTGFHQMQRRQSRDSQRELTRQYSAPSLRTFTKASEDMPPKLTTSVSLTPNTYEARNMERIPGPDTEIQQESDRSHRWPKHLIKAKDKQDRKTRSKTREKSRQRRNRMCSKNRTKFLSSYEVFIRYADKDPVDGHSRILSKECFRTWVETRRNGVKNAEHSFRKALIAHLCGKDGRRPFPPDLEPLVVSEIRKKRVWPCFVGKKDPRILNIGNKGFRHLAFHEGKHSSAKESSPVKGSKSQNRSISKASKSSSSKSRVEHKSRVHIKKKVVQRSTTEESLGNTQTFHSSSSTSSFPISSLQSNPTINLFPPKERNRGVRRGSVTLNNRSSKVDHDWKPPVMKRRRTLTNIHVLQSNKDIKDPYDRFLVDLERVKAFEQSQSDSSDYSAVEVDENLGFKFNSEKYQKQKVPTFEELGDVFSQESSAIEGFELETSSFVGEAADLSHHNIHINLDPSAVDLFNLEDTSNTANHSDSLVLEAFSDVSAEEISKVVQLRTLSFPAFNEYFKEVNKTHRLNLVQPRDICGDVKLLRYIRSCNGDVSRAFQLIRSLLSWRQKHKVDVIREGLIAKNQSLEELKQSFLIGQGGGCHPFFHEDANGDLVDVWILCQENFEMQEQSVGFLQDHIVLCEFRSLVLDKLSHMRKRIVGFSVVFDCEVVQESQVPQSNSSFSRWFKTLNEWDWYFAALSEMCFKWYGGSCNELLVLGSGQLFSVLSTSLKNTLQQRHQHVSSDVSLLNTSQLKQEALRRVLGHEQNWPSFPSQAIKESTGRCPASRKLSEFGALEGVQRETLENKVFRRRCVE